MELKVLPQHLAEFVGDLGHGGVQDRDEPRVKRQQVQARSVDAEQGAHELFSVVLAVESDEKVDGGVVDHLPVDAVGQIVQICFQHDLVADVCRCGVFRFFFDGGRFFGFAWQKKMVKTCVGATFSSFLMHAQVCYSVYRWLKYISVSLCYAQNF